MELSLEEGKQESAWGKGVLPKLGAALSSCLAAPPLSTCVKHYSPAQVFTRGWLFCCHCGRLKEK